MLSRRRRIGPSKGEVFLKGKKNIYTVFAGLIEVIRITHYLQAGRHQYWSGFHAIATIAKILDLATLTLFRKKSETGFEIEQILISAIQ